MRINKYLASCQLGSRRAVEQLILDKKVRVNNLLIDTLAFDVNLENDSVTVSGKKVSPVVNLTYAMFHKPKGCICTTSDEKGRKTVYDYIDLDTSINCVGRLDYDTEGLLLMTNDGDLHFRLTHPSTEIPKTYLVKVEREVLEGDLARLRKGILLDGIMTRRCKIKLKEASESSFSYLMTIYEGRNRQIRRMFDSIGIEVKFLRRIAIGDLKLGGLSRGEYRFLRPEEVIYLKKL